MRTIANIIWILCGGIFTAIVWVVIGAFCYVTVVGIPLGRQAFKMASLTLTPFGKTIVYGGGAPSVVANFFWVIVAGIPMAFLYAALGTMFCMTIIGIPWGIQCFKMAKLSFLPFGSSVM
jgi:uncharacterized membrane protein YccF (DUF307 family)